MARKRTWLFGPYGWIAGIVLVAALWGGSSVFTTEKVDVESYRVTRGEVSETVTAAASGTAFAENDVRINSEYTGSIVKVNFDEGQWVNAGDVILEMDSEVLQAGLTQAQANLKVAEANLRIANASVKVQSTLADTDIAAAKARYEGAKDALDRLEKQGPESVSQQQKDEAQRNKEIAQKNYEAAKTGDIQKQIKQEGVTTAAAQIAQLQAAVDSAQAQLNRAKVSAPFSGVVAELYVDLGASVTVGTPLCRLVDSAHLKISAPIDEVDSAKLALGQKVRLSLDAYPGLVLNGELTYISPVVSTAKQESRTVKIEVKPTEQVEMFKVGMSVDVIVVTNTKSGVVSVPTDAIVDDKGNKIVYVIEGGRAIKHPVKIGLSNWDYSEVLEGIGEGDVIVASLGIEGLKNNVPVRVKEKA